ncbi:MAG TPA: hypothetical protein VE397_19495 [Stellaceae bacterium]|jgi:hypothetical protein|nr:hypothetical protein [Stellaceae bacterium]
MDEGWVLVALFVLVGLLVLVSFVENAVRHCNAKRRHVPPGRTSSLR